jgi:hypothetical protein
MTLLVLQRGITGDDFLLYMERFIQQSRIMKDKPLSLVLKNQQPHRGIKFIDLAKENAVVISFPPHTFLKLQPLEKSIYGPYRNFVNRCSDAWVRSNPEKTRTIYDTPLIVSQ